MDTIKRNSPVVVIRFDPHGPASRRSKTSDQGLTWREKRKLRDHGFTDRQIAVLEVLKEMNQLIREAERRRAAMHRTVPVTGHSPSVIAIQSTVKQRTNWSRPRHDSAVRATLFPMSEARNKLKRWQDEKIIVVVPSVSHDAHGPKMFETRATVRLVDENRLVLSSIEDSQTEALDLAEASLSVHDDNAVEIKWPNGKSTLISEE